MTCKFGGKKRKHKGKKEQGIQVFFKAIYIKQKENFLTGSA